LKPAALLRRALLPTFRRLEARQHVLSYLFLELTQACNVACLHCGSDCIRDTTTPPLAREDILRVMREIAAAQDPGKVMVVLSGGEPLCYPGVFELGAEIHALGFPWGMVTNGFAWTEKSFAQAKAAGLGSITVSLDGFEDAHDWLRGRSGSFQKAIKLLGMLQVDPFYGAMDVITCVNQRNLPHLDAFRDLLQGLGVPSWRITTIFPIGRAAENPDLQLDATGFQELMAKVERFRSLGGIQVAFAESAFLGRHECVVRGEPFFCRAGINIGGVMVNGDILACPNIDRRFAQGNIHRDSFMNIWQHRYQVFRDRRWMKRGQCSGCKQWRLCQGEAFHLWDPGKNETRLCHFKHFGLGTERKCVQHKAQVS